MRIDHDLRRLLITELCAMVDGYSQVLAAAFLDLRQPQISALRRGRGDGFSIGRLLRLIAHRKYNVEVHLRPMERPFAKPRPLPAVKVLRYDRFGRVVNARACT